MIDLQMGEVKFYRCLKVDSKQANVGVLFVTKYHPKLKKIVQIM